MSGATTNGGRLAMECVWQREEYINNTYRSTGRLCLGMVNLWRATSIVAQESVEAHPSDPAGGGKALVLSGKRRGIGLVNLGERLRGERGALAIFLFADSDLTDARSLQQKIAS